MCFITIFDIFAFFEPALENSKNSTTLLGRQADLDKAPADYHKAVSWLLAVRHHRVGDKVPVARH